MLEILNFCSEEFGESGAKGVIFIDDPSLVTVRSAQKLLGHSPHFTAVVQKKRNTMRGQINNVLCSFGKVDAVISTQLLYICCSSLYGSVVWNLNHV